MTGLALAAAHETKMLQTLSHMSMYGGGEGIVCALIGVWCALIGVFTPVAWGPSNSKQMEVSMHMYVLV